ncbi:MAG TPA: hypothetical protein VGH40_02785 [Roseiarcus sp.]|jgi:hypothetical protein
MRHNTVRLAAIIGASLLPLVAFAPVASANGLAPYTSQNEWSSYVRQEAPWAQEARARDEGLRRSGVVYLNGWSSSSNPHDCNKGCVNSNG